MGLQFICWYDHHFFPAEYGLLSHVLVVLGRVVPIYLPLADSNLRVLHQNMSSRASGLRRSKRNSGRGAK